MPRSSWRCWRRSCSLRCAVVRAGRAIAGSRERYPDAAAAVRRGASHATGRMDVAYRVELRALGTDLARTTDSEARALTRLAFDELGSAPGGIGDIHRAIADRVFRLTGPAARPVRFAHRTITDASYAAVRGGFGVAGRAADVALRGRGA